MLICRAHLRVYAGAANEARKEGTVFFSGKKPISAYPELVGKYIKRYTPCPLAIGEERELEYSTEIGASETVVVSCPFHGWADGTSEHFFDWLEMASKPGYSDKIAHLEFQATWGNPLFTLVYFLFYLDLPGILSFSLFKVPHPPKHPRISHSTRFG